MKIIKTIRLEPETVEKIDKMRAERKRSLGQMIDLLCNHAFKTYDKEVKK